MSEPETTGPSDYEKLMDLAQWFDIQDAKREATYDDEVQRDLRRIARRLLAIDGDTSFTRNRRERFGDIANGRD